MSVEVTELNLDCEIGEESDVTVLLLPTSIKWSSEGQEYSVYPASTTSVLKILNSNAIQARLGAGGGRKIAYTENRAAEWLGPTILITSALLSQNPALLTVTLNVISSYVYEIFRGKATDPTMKCTFAYIGKGGRKKIYYEGPTSGLPEVRQVIEELENAPGDVRRNR